MKWAIGVYERWQALRSQIHSARYTATWNKNNHLIQPIHESVAMEQNLKHDVYDFIVEIRKENGTSIHLAHCMTCCKDYLCFWSMSTDLKTS